MPDPKIVSATISAMPKRMFDPMPSVTVKLDDNSEVKLFTYYPDEISFTEGEFIGLTVKEAHALRHKKDVNYLRS